MIGETQEVDVETSEREASANVIESMPLHF